MPGPAGSLMAAAHMQAHCSAGRRAGKMNALAAAALPQATGWPAACTGLRRAQVEDQWLGSASIAFSNVASRRW